MPYYRWQPGWFDAMRGYGVGKRNLPVDPKVKCNVSNNQSKHSENIMMPLMPIPRLGAGIRD